MKPAALLQAPDERFLRSVANIAYLIWVSNPGMPIVDRYFITEVIHAVDRVLAQDEFLANNVSSECEDIYEYARGQLLRKVQLEFGWWTRWWRLSLIRLGIDSYTTLFYTHPVLLAASVARGKEDLEMVGR